MFGVGMSLLAFSPLLESLGPCWTLGSPHGGLVGALGWGTCLFTPLEVTSMAPTGNWHPATQANSTSLYIGS